MKFRYLYLSISIYMNHGLTKMRSGFAGEGLSRASGMLKVSRALPFESSTASSLSSSSISGSTLRGDGASGTS